MNPRALALGMAVAVVFAAPAYYAAWWAITHKPQQTAIAALAALVAVACCRANVQAQRKGW